MEDELLSNVAWDKGSLWSGRITLADGRTASFEIDGYEPVESIPEAASKTLRFLIANESLIRHKVAVSTINCFSDTWLYENTITPEELARRINLDSVTIWDEGDGQLLYEADGLFTDHCIQVSIDADGEIGEPQLEG